MTLAAWNEALCRDIETRFSFLEEELGYAAPVLVPARVEDRIIVAYRSEQAQRQVEISGVPSGYWVHCEIRRLVEGEADAYRRGSIADWELRLMEGSNDANLFERGAILDRIAGTLRANPAILRGESWIDRQEIDRAAAGSFHRRFGFRPAPAGTPGRLDVARERAAFLVRDFGVALEFDSGNLSPHESEMWLRLRYRRGETTVDIVNSDIRVQDEWAVRVNDTAIPVSFENWDAGLEAALAAVRRQISE